MAGHYGRQIDNKFLNGGGDAKALEYNPASGGQKSLIVGPRLIPISTGLNTWTTNITSAAALPDFGMILAIFNTSATTYAITVGQDATVTAQATGAVDSNGNVGVACPSGYTYVSMGYNRWIIGSNAALVAYIMEDPTRFNQQTPAYMQQNVGPQPIS